jgi:hypothetical protein
MKPMTTDDTYKEYMTKALFDQIQHLNKTKPGREAVEAVLSEFGFEKMTTEKLAEFKREIGL